MEMFKASLLLLDRAREAANARWAANAENLMLRMAALEEAALKCEYGLSWATTEMIRYDSGSWRVGRGASERRDVCLATLIAVSRLDSRARIMADLKVMEANVEQCIFQKIEEAESSCR